MNGLHLTADLRGCAADAQCLLDAATLRALCERAVADAGLHGVATLFHAFAPARPGEDAAGVAGAADALPASGVTGVVLLAESHLAVHTWPELRAVTLDVYVCNRSADHGPRAETVLKRLIEAFAPAQVLRQAIRRGALPATPPGPPDAPVTPPGAT
jgi:spermidine synthase/S-adenosylmethionine decarboxylase